MTEILMALATAAALLLPIVVFIVFVSIAAVRRGEFGSHHAPDPAADTGATAAVAETAALPARELSVIELLLLGTALFVLAMIGLLGVSLLGHL